MLSIYSLLIIFDRLYLLFDSYTHYEIGWTIYPPLSQLENEQQLYSSNSPFEVYLQILTLLNICFISLLIYCVFATFKNLKSKK